VGKKAVQPPKKAGGPAWGRDSTTVQRPVGVTYAQGNSGGHRGPKRHWDRAAWVWEPGKNDPPAAGAGGWGAPPPVTAAARGEGTPELPQERVLTPQEEDEQQLGVIGDEVDEPRTSEGMVIEPPPAEADPLVPPADADTPTAQQAAKKSKRAAPRTKVARRQRATITPGEVPEARVSPASPKPQTPEEPVVPQDSPDQADPVALTLITRRGTAYRLSAESSTPTLPDDKPPRVFQEAPSAT
jgi:hypothetical protein